MTTRDNGADKQQTMVAFSVYKAARYLFDCVGLTQDAGQVPHPTVDLPQLEALRIDAVDVVKRLDFSEVDRLIACCREHPPQVVVVPATEGDKPKFEEFALYLKERQRAGVCTLPGGRLLLLAPLEQDNLQLRCVVVKAKPSAQDRASVSAADMTAIRIEGAAPVPVHTPLIESQAHASSMHPPLATEVSQKPPRNRSRSRHRKRASQEEEVAHLTTEGSVKEPGQTNQAEDPPADDIVLLRDLARLERATRIAQLRQEYEAFNDLHYQILRKWSSEDPEPDS